MPRPTHTHPPPPSTATTGFFQPKPTLPNPATSDPIYARITHLLLPPAQHAATSASLARLGAISLSRPVQAWIANSDAHPPVLQQRDTFGAPLDRLVTSEGWRQLQALGLREGIVAAGYERREGAFARLVQALRLMIWNPSSASVTCPSAMQDGAAALLERCLRGRVEPRQRVAMERALEHLVSRDPGTAWTAGQWMTERTGGSDVQGTETRARPVSREDVNQQQDFVASDGTELGPWVVDGFKWFSSATDSDMTILLAKTPGTDKLSCFFAPTRIRRRGEVAADVLGTVDPRANTEFNGIYPQRLKNKLGTKSLPTAELELKGMRAWMVGEEGHGVKEISTVLTVTRVYNAVSASSSLGRGLAVARAFSLVRKAGGGRLLSTIPSHVKMLADISVDYAGQAMLAAFTAYCLGVSEAATDGSSLPLLRSKRQGQLLLRILTPIAKAQTALSAVAGIRVCMESLGGVGYLENDDTELNLARLFRDTNVLPIWEGTTNIMAGDVVRVLKGRDGAEVLKQLADWLQLLRQSAILPMDMLEEELHSIGATVQEAPVDQLLYQGADLLQRLGWVVTTALLVQDASRDRNSASVEIAQRWLAKRDARAKQRVSSRPWADQAAADADVVYGAPAQAASRL